MTDTDHYLFVMWDGGGAVPPILNVASHLVASGKQVSILGEDSMKPEIEAAACRFLPYQFAPNRPDRRPESDPYPDWKGDSPFKILGKLLYGNAAAYAKDVITRCKETEYDKVVVDGFLIGAMIGAEAAGRPFSVIWPAIDPIPHPGRPPDGLGLLPGRTLPGKIRNRILNWIFRKILQSGNKLLNPIRTQWGLAPLHHPFDSYRKAEKVLLLSSRSFDYPVTLPANTYFAGPQLKDPAWASSPVVEPEPPYILVSFGSSYQDQKALYQKMIDALSTLKQPVVVTLGKVFEPEEFRAPAHIRVLQSAAHQEILPTCGLVIHHGGHGITMKSIMAGLPQLVIPIGRDQPGNAARIVYHGIGLRAKPKTTPDKLLEKVKALLMEDRFTLAARQMRQRIQEEKKSISFIELL